MIHSPINPTYAGWLVGMERTWFKRKCNRVLSITFGSCATIDRTAVAARRIALYAGEEVLGVNAPDRLAAVWRRADLQPTGLGRFLLFNALLIFVGADVDPPWLHRLRHLAHQIDLQ